MKSQKLFHQKSLSMPRSKRPSDANLQLLKPIRPQFPIINKSPQNRSSKKQNTLLPEATFLSCTLNKANINESSSCGMPSKSPDSVSEFEVQKENSKPCQKLINKLEKKLMSIGKNDYKNLFQTYFEMLDSVILHDAEFSSILILVKNGLISSFNNYYKSKTSKHLIENQNLKNSLNSISKDKESLINKLNQLSSQNINLIISNEEMIEKYKKVRDSLIPHSTTNKKRPSLLEELSQKDEKIKELSDKLDEMHTHENKLLQIIEKINTSGINIETLYHEASAHKNIFLKRKKNPVPSINLTFLEDPNAPNNS